jgi:hypothetical protein
VANTPYLFTDQRWGRWLTSMLLMATLGAVAEEGGEGHYNPGQTADFNTALPGYPSFAYQNALFYYDGNAGLNRHIPLNGFMTVNLQADVYTDYSVLLWETPLKVLGGNYTVFGAIPYTWLTASADVLVGGGGRVHVHESASGLGDIYFAPAALGWTNGDFKWDGRFGIYAPSGSFDKTRLANPGLGFWTFEPELTFDWRSSKFGTEVGVFAGLDFNTQNPDTSYTAGDVFHIDFTLAQHLPLGGGVIGAGASGYWYKQFSGDSGPGAVLGSFETEQIGVGPVVSYIRKLDKTTLALQATWLPQLDAQNTLKGNYVWIRATLVF